MNQPNPPSSAEQTNAQPHWFTRGLQTPSTQGSVTVEGANIAYEVWDQVPDGAPKQGLVLIHGSNAHLEWWRFVAPMLADQFRVAALDLSGHGNSDWRETYDGGQQGREVWAVCQAAQLGERPIVVGHSYGGYVALEAAHQFSDQLAGVVFMDFTVAPPEQYVEWGLRVAREGVEPKRKLRTYADREQALGRFRLVPEQPVYHPQIIRHLAEHSLKSVPDGWTWKFDPCLFDYMEMGPDQQAKFAGIACPTAIVLGEDSADEGADYADNMVRISDGLLPVYTVPGTHHHLMFDEPVAVAMCLKSLVLAWHQAAQSAALATALARFATPTGDRA